ncbi:MAG: hypothetical protein CGW95_12570 [Phenylobacterium zucineum]|nr:MAG: hypothetical protein CGW95_12570 [Phenylobacterium zucineum]
MIIMRLTGGYHLVLAGLDQVEVSPGQDVSPGMRVGKMAGSGPSQPQLYLELRAGDVPVDPAPLLKTPGGWPK